MPVRDGSHVNKDNSEKIAELEEIMSCVGHLSQEGSEGRESLRLYLPISFLSLPSTTLPSFRVSRFSRPPSPVYVLYKCGSGCHRCTVVHYAPLIYQERVVLVGQRLESVVQQWCRTSSGHKLDAARPLACTAEPLAAEALQPPGGKTIGRA